MSPRLMSMSSASRMVTDIGANASSTGPSAVSIDAIVRREARRQHHDLVARLEHAAGDLPGVAAVVVGGVVGLVLRPDHVLHREAGVDEVAVGGDVHLLEVVQQRRALVPGHVGRAVDDVVAVQRRDRDEGEVVHVELHGEGAELGLDLLEALLVQSTRSILLTHSTRCGMPSSDARKAWRRDCSSTPLRASTRISARSAVDAPVTMLRVYWMWPGVSAMMNLRLGVAK